MMSYNAKNYMTDGGDTLVIGGALKMEGSAAMNVKSGATLTVKSGGTLAVEDGATVTGIESAMLPDPTPSSKGGMKLGAPVAESEAVDVAGVNTVLNALITSLTTAGVISAFPAITTQPADATGAVNTTVHFTVVATGAGPLTYKWQSKTATAADYSDSTATGAATDTLSIGAQTTRDGAKFRCVVTDAFGNSVTSDAATLTVTEAEGTGGE